MTDLETVLSQTPVSRAEDALLRLKDIGAALDPVDGLFYFNDLYVHVTEAVIEAQRVAPFGAPEFMAALDVVFANYYFGALRASLAGRPDVPRAWAPLFAARQRRDIHPLQFAFAGMNAHINRDLCVALVDTFAIQRIPMRRSGPEHGDYERVNGLIGGVEAQAKSAYFGPLAVHLDRAFDGVDDIIVNWGIQEARDAAWINGEALSALRGLGALGNDYLLTLDGTVGFAGRGLLVPTAL